MKYKTLIHFEPKQLLNDFKIYCILSIPRRSCVKMILINESAGSRLLMFLVTGQVLCETIHFMVFSPIITGSSKIPQS